METRMIELAEKFNNVVADVKKVVVEKDEAIDSVALAILSRKHVFLLGGPGQAKSYIIDNFRKRITGSRQFSKLLTKQADEESLFGRLDLKSLINGTPKINTTNMIPEADFVYGDETFKCNEGVLNSLLKLLNEREYTNEGITVKCPLNTFFGSSNEIPDFSNPEEAILKPFYDRLEIRIVTDYIKDKCNLLYAMKLVRDKGANQIGATIELDELKELQAYMDAIIIPDEVDELVFDIKAELDRKGIVISDRKVLGYYKIAQAQAIMNYRNSVIPEDLKALKNYLWECPEDIPVVKNILDQYCINPLKQHIAQLLALADETYKETIDFKDDKPSARNKQLMKFRKELIKLSDMLNELAQKAFSEADKKLIEQATEKFEEYNRTISDNYGFTYVAIPELRALYL